MLTALQRVRPAIRVLRRRPGLAVARLLTVSVVVSALASVAAIAAASVFRRLPFPDPDRLVEISLLPNDAAGRAGATPLFPVVFDHMAARGAAFEAVVGIWVADRAVAGRAEPESVQGARVTDGFFAMLGAEIALGRTFTSEEVHTDAPVVVLSHGLWMRFFGGDSAAVGQVLQIDRQPYSVIGVTGEGFEPAYTSTQFWTPLRLQAGSGVRATVVQTLGRLRPGATVAAAEADVQPVLAAAREQAPDLLTSSVLDVTSLRESRFGSRRNTVALLAAIVLALAVLATANLATLTVADLSSRHADVALRSVLGGSTCSTLVDEVLPGVMLAIVGTGLGLWASATATPWMLSLDPALSRAGLSIDIDLRVALVSAVGSTMVMVTSIVIPVWRIAGQNLAGAFAAARATAPHTRRLQAWLTAVQTAVAVVLISAAAMVAVALQRDADVDPGFDPTHVITGQLRLAESAFPDHAARSRFISTVIERLADTPGVLGAGTTLNPFTAGSSFTTNVAVEDAPRPDGGRYDLQYRRVSPGYFNAMRIPIVEGRDFAPADTQDRPPVAIVSESFARRFWPDGTALGKRIRRGAATAPWAEVVGVAGDVRDAGLARETGPVMYTSYHQGSTATTAAALVVRTQGDPDAALAAIKAAIWSVDPSQPIANIVRLDRFLESSLGPQQFRTWLVAWCGLAGVLLAVIGIYGVTSRAVTARTREAGIRIALGAQPSGVWMQMSASSLRVVVAGAGTGLCLSMVADRGLAQLLPELGQDGWGLRIIATALVAAVGGAAAIAAGRRVVAIDLLHALRGD